MKVTIQPSRLNGTVRAPSSKSSMQRACAAALLTKGETTIYNAGHSNDDKAAIEIIRTLGAKLTIGQDQLIVNSSGFPSQDNGGSRTINCGESGLGIRMFTPLLALSDTKTTIRGEGSLLTRPMDFFDTILPQLGVTIQSNKGKLPLVIQGPLKPADISIDGSLSSQFLTGLLMAFGISTISEPVSTKNDSVTTKNESVNTMNESVSTMNEPEGDNENNSTFSIRVNDLKSKPYIDLTLDVMKRFGMNCPENRNYEEFLFKRIHTAATESKHEYTVEGDWSGGAFLLVAGAIAGPITVRGLDLSSTQADKAIIDALMSANAGIAMEAKGIKIHATKMNGFEFDASDCPDLFPPLVALAAYCHGQTRIKGIDRLLHKESNRALTLQDEFDKMGVFIELEGNEMIINGNGIVKGADVHSQHDHRIAMACAVAALGANSETVIEEAQAVNKSYPGFYSDLKYLGASVSLPFHPVN